jgi:hypothetical protein
MPTIRCVKCSKASFYRNTRGSSIKGRACECGGSFEKIGGNYPVSGQHPFNPSQTYTYKSFIGEYFYADANSKKELFVRKDGYYVKIENPILATHVFIGTKEPLSDHSAYWECEENSSHWRLVNEHFENPGYKGLPYGGVMKEWYGWVWKKVAHFDSTKDKFVATHPNPKRRQRAHFQIGEFNTLEEAKAAVLKANHPSTGIYSTNY